MRSNMPCQDVHANERSSPLYFATDPVGDGRPIYPDIDRPVLPELWRENLRKRERKKYPKKPPENKHTPDPDHRIDDFA